MSSIYRIRPCNGYTIDEIENHYLWFSRRRGFKDVNDANIGAFLDNNEKLLQALQKILTPEGIKELREKMDCTGICCFTDRIPTTKERRKFPKSQKGICLEYNHEVIEAYFKNSHYALTNCFYNVQYFPKPIVFAEDDGYHILAERTAEGGFIYRSILELSTTEKGLDTLVKLLLTRINANFHHQNEKRIILGGRNIPSFEPDLLGYKVEIPENAIVAIHTYKDTPQEFVNKINSSNPNIEIRPID